MSHDVVISVGDRRLLQDLYDQACGCGVPGAGEAWEQGVAAAREALYDRIEELGFGCRPEGAGAALTWAQDALESLYVEIIPF